MFSLASSKFLAMRNIALYSVRLFPIAGFFTPLPSSAVKGIAVALKTAVNAGVGAIEMKKQHGSAKNLHIITGNFDETDPKSYKQVMSAFGEIFIHFNLQFVHLLDALDFHWSKAMYKLALDSVIKIFNGFKEIQENNEDVPLDFSEEFIIKCFLKGDSKGGVFDKVKSKLLGESLGGKLTDDFFTQDLFEMPLVKAKNNKFYGSYSDDQNKFLYRHKFDHEDLKHPLPCMVPHKRPTFYFYFLPFLSII